MQAVEIAAAQRGWAATKRQVLFHRKGTELAEFGIFLDQEPFTPRPERLGGESSSGST